MNNIEKIRIGIVGLNFGVCIVDDIVNGDAAPFFTVAGVCDLDRERAAHLSEKFNVRVIKNLDDILAAEDIPVVGLFTAPSGRAKLMERILDAGKDIITTKPFELDAEEAESVLMKARRLGRKIMLNSPSPMPSPDLRQILEWTDIYNLGNIIACRCDTWASYRENADGTWYDDPNLCPVAPIFRLGIYLINDIARLMGKAKTVQVLHSQMLTKRPTPDNAQLGILFESGAVANVFASFCVEDGQYYKNSLVLNFERGTVTRNMCAVTREQTARETNLSLVTLDSNKKQTVINTTIAGSTEQYQWDEFYRILTGKAEIPEAADRAMTEAIRVVNAMARAEQSGRTESVR